MYQLKEEKENHSQLHWKFLSFKTQQMLSNFHFLSLKFRENKKPNESLPTMQAGY